MAKLVVDGAAEEVVPEFKSIADIPVEAEAEAVDVLPDFDVNSIAVSGEAIQLSLTTQKALINVTFDPLKVERTEGTTDEEIQTWLLQDFNSRFNIVFALQASERMARMQVELDELKEKVVGNGAD